MALNIFDRAAMDPYLHAALSDPTVSARSIAQTYFTSARAVGRWRAKHAGEGLDHPQAPEEPAAQPTKGTVSVSHDGAEIKNVVVEGDLNGDWTKVFELFNLDGSKFAVVDDTVRMSTWQQSARSKDGDRDTIQLYSYSARFRRLTQDDIAPEVFERWQVNLRETEWAERPLLSQGGGGTYVMLPSDPQIGKKGTAEAVENWKQGVTEHLAEAQSLLHQGVPLDGLHLASMGDEIENVANNYTNQPHTIELNLSQQLELAFDMDVWQTREALKVGLPLSKSAVISNHGEWTRNDSKDPITTQSDNASTFIARQVKKFFDEQIQWGVQEIEWHIGGGRPGLIVPLSGVDNYFSHGYIEQGKGGSTELRTKNAVERQILGFTEEHVSVKNYFMAHYHHSYYNHFEGRNLFGCPALEAERSSEYMANRYGVWSRPGLLGLVVGGHNKNGWSNLNVF